MSKNANVKIGTDGRYNLDGGNPWMASAKDINRVWLERIAESIAGLKYGHVQITVHDGKIVQIDRLERRRFEASGEPVSTGKG